MFDMLRYLSDKAAKLNLTVQQRPATINTDSCNFLLGNGKTTAPISISGLEEIQNGSESQIKSILDCRFDMALETLQTPPAL